MIALFVHRDAATLAGHDCHGWKIVEVSAATLTPEQRAELVRYSSGEGADYALPQHTCEELAEALPSAVPALLDRAIQVRAATIERVYALIVAGARADASGACIPSRYSIAGVADREYSAARERFDLTPQYAALQIESARLSVLRDAERAVEKAAAEKAAAEKKAAAEIEKAAGFERLHAWAIQHGSELLRARIEHGYEWAALARTEYVDYTIKRLGIDLPDGATPDGYDVADDLDRDAPTLPEIQEVARIRETAKKLELSIGADLHWLRYTLEDDGEFDRIGRAEIRVTVTCPDGHESAWYFLAPGEQAHVVS